MDAFKWALFCYYIFIGTVQVLLMKASGASAKGTGKGVAYNTASAMVFIEGGKILCCLAVERWQGDAYRAEQGEARKTTHLAGWVYYAIPGFLYSVENNLKIPATVILHPHVFALFNNSKVIFAAIGMVLLLGKRFSVLQWMSMVLLGASLCVAKVQMLLPAPEAKVCTSGNATGASPRMLAADAFRDPFDPSLHRPGGGEPGRLLADATVEEAQSQAVFFFGIVLVLAASMISGLAGVFNELLLKRRDSDVALWRKNIWTYQWGVIFNVVGLLASSWRDEDGFSLFRGYDVWVWAMIFVTALLGISVSMIMKYFDNVVKCFGGSLILYSTTAASMILFGSSVDAAFVLGLLVYSISSYFYAGDHVQKLEIYDRHRAEIDALVKARSQQGSSAAEAVPMRSPRPPSPRDEEEDEEEVPLTFAQELSPLGAGGAAKADVFGRRAGV